MNHRPRFVATTELLGDFGMVFEIVGDVQVCWSDRLFQHVHCGVEQMVGLQMLASLPFDTGQRLHGHILLVVVCRLKDAQRADGKSFGLLQPV